MVDKDGAFDDSVVSIRRLKNSEEPQTRQSAQRNTLLVRLVFSMSPFSFRSRTKHSKMCLHRRRLTAKLSRRYTSLPYTGCLLLKGSVFCSPLSLQPFRRPCKSPRSNSINHMTRKTSLIKHDGRSAYGQMKSWTFLPQHHWTGPYAECSSPFWIYSN